MKSILTALICILMLVTFRNSAYGTERVIGIYSSLTYYPLTPQVGVKLNSIRNKYLTIDNILCLTYFQEKEVGIRNWKNANGKIIRSDTTEHKFENAGLSYRFIPTLILWKYLFVGAGIQADGEMRLSGGAFQFNGNMLANFGCKINKLSLGCLLITSRQIGVSFSVDLPSRKDTL